MFVTNPKVNQAHEELGMNLTRTHEVLTTKVTIAKVNGNGKKPKKNIEGYEYSPPAQGCPYVVYLGKGNVFKTSPVRDVKEVNDAIMLKTSNSIYRINYLRRPSVSVSTRQ
jgi:hypothetical protein